MKKLFNYFHNEAGTVTVYLFYLVTLLLLLAVSVIQHYQNETNLVKMEIEHLKLEMLQQLAYQSLINEWEEWGDQEKVEFQYPIGEAKISISNHAEELVKIIINASTAPPYQRSRIYYY
ncbi:hypothetical protein [Amphibacillus cookii]|uniref:hypothetical protein n=1 Tax=Amphibacillus cookii TaxID=767787 RepID=UPI001959C2BB|nr:hypothetical protein [Amphibacillus cookii]MBM7542409.1 hypothetical protein [Amphibacillus cookii]